MTAHGLSSSEAIAGLLKYGKNEIPHSNPKTPLKMLLGQLPTLMNGLLGMAALFSFLFSDLVDGFFILATICINSIFTFIQEYKAEKTLESLIDFTPQQVNVLRDGKEQPIAATQIIPGDVVILREGDKIPADGVLLQATALEIDESAFTGESLPVRKEQNDLCLMGTLLIKGRGTLLIQATGGKTRFGQIAQTMGTIKTTKTLLERQLADLGKLLTVLAITTAGIVVTLGILRGQETTTLVLTAVSIAVAAIPEGLPLVLTVALAIGTNRLAHKKALVRKLQAVETLGAIQILLTDKTGTLTENSMRVKKIWTPYKQVPTQMYLAATLGNTATLLAKDSGKFDIVGDKTDGALLLWAKESPIQASALIQAGKVVDEFVFDVITKTITTVWKKDSKQFVFVRGAPEAIIARCDFTAVEKIQLTEAYQALAKEGLRTIAFGYKEGAVSSRTNREQYESHLTLLGFIGIYDPPRKEVPDAIHRAQTAGIRTIMVTGDNEMTALKIAKEIGLINSSSDVITGEQLRLLSDEEAIKILLKIQIIARSLPEDKLRVATLLQAQGFTVGVTGDGVNDALILKKADVGIAMGESGTDVAKEASDIIITDDNFSTIIRAVEEGRTIYHNILQAIIYLVTSNLSEICLIVFATALNLPAILLPTQILWINLATDGFPALALATDKTSHAVLNDPPRNTKIPLITKSRLVRIVAIGTGLAGTLVLFYSILLDHTPVLVARTIVFDGLIVSHLLLALLIRGRSLRTLSPLFISTILITLVVQTIITFTPFFQRLFQIGF